MRNALLFSLVLALLLGAAPVRIAHAAILPSDLVRSFDVDTIYYVSPADGKRYSFPSVGVYHTWYANFERVAFVSAEELAAIPFGGVVYVRPGSAMVKVTTDPKTYAVAAGGKLRHVANEEAAASVYGADWNTHIIDIDQAFFANYDIGATVAGADDYVPAYELHMNGEIFQTLDRPAGGAGAAPQSMNGTLPSSIGAGSGFYAETAMLSPSNADRMLLAANDVVFARCETSVCAGVAGPFFNTENIKVESYACDAYRTCRRTALGSVHILPSSSMPNLSVNFDHHIGTKTATLTLAASGGTPSHISITREAGQTTTCANTNVCQTESPPLSLGPYTYTALACDEARRCVFADPITIGPLY